MVGPAAPHPPAGEAVRRRGKAKAAAKAAPDSGPSDLFETRFMDGQWYLVRIDPVTSEETYRPIDMTDYFPEPAPVIPEVPPPAEAAPVHYDETRANLQSLAPGTSKFANRFGPGAMVPSETVQVRPGLDDADDEEDEDEEAVEDDAVLPSQVWCCES